VSTVVAFLDRTKSYYLIVYKGKIGNKSCDGKSVLIIWFFDGTFSCLVEICLNYISVSQD